MPTFRNLVIFVPATIAMVGIPISLIAQSAPAAIQTNSVAIHILLPKSSYAIGEKPIAAMTIKNISSNEVWFSTDPYLERIHITRKEGGEPPKTELHRHLLGDFRPGDGPGLGSGPVVGRSIAPGSVDTQRYDLTYFYDLSNPGDYRVYMEIYDPAGPKDGSGHWLRTNTVQFKIQAEQK